MAALWSTFALQLITLAVLSAASFAISPAIGFTKLQPRGAALLQKDSKDRIKVPEFTSSGFLPVKEDLGSSMFHIYWEAAEPSSKLDTTPIILWLQGGPGCSSLFGALYINGPYFVNEDDLTLRRNLGTWGRLYGLLYVEQPVGVGFSRLGKAPIPKDELEVAEDLYLAMQSFYRANPSFSKRPLVVTGESYAGKYVPSISHYILQVTAMHSGFLPQLRHPRNLKGLRTDAPLFRLGGFAIGNGWTDADVQTRTTAETAYNLGLIDGPQRARAEEMQARVLEKVRAREWRAARELSDSLNAFITTASGTATLEDVRRNLGYDGNSATDRVWNSRHVKRAIGVPEDAVWASCSPEVDQVLSPDVMKSVKHLVSDVVEFHPILLYQGQYDAECGVASNDAWIHTMDWRGQEAFAGANRSLWMVNGRVGGYRKQHANLTVLVVRNTGHMMPHDSPLLGQLMIEGWIEREVLGREYRRDVDGVTPQMERAYAARTALDEGPNANPASWWLGRGGGGLRAVSGSSSSSSSSSKSGVAGGGSSGGSGVAA